MKLIGDIINELVDSEKSISAALLKTKVLASRIKNTELIEWVNNELSGYKSEESLPEYRKVQGVVTGTFMTGNRISGGYQYNDQPLPTMGLAPELEKTIRCLDFYQSVSTLESYIGDNKSGKLEKVFPPEFKAIIEKHMVKMGNPELHLVTAKCYTSINSIVNTLSIIRSKLLDFMLKIEEEFGTSTELEDLKNKNEKISTIMNQTIINQGDGNVVNTGGNSTITAKIKIKKGDKNTLSDNLKENGLTDEEIVPLIEIIDQEEPDREQGKFGAKVNEWIQKMIGKTLDGTWQIGTGAAGTLLAEAIKAYYGM